MIKIVERKIVRKSSAVAALAAAAILGTEAQAQGAETFVVASAINGVRDTRLLPNGDVELVMEDGRVVRILAEDVRNLNGVISIEASALAEAGLVAEAAGATGLNLPLIGLGVVAAGGLIAVAASGGGDDAPAINTAPVFTSATSASVAENTVATGFVASATDAERNPITFAIAGGADAARFTINGSTGALSFVAAPNFEAPADAGANNVYDVIISASDGTSTVQQAVAITVTNVNDIAPVFTSAATATAIENRTVAFTATATDAEAGNTVTFALSGADAGLFIINAATGVVTFRVAPDFEAPADAGANNVYDVVVTASDGVNTTNQSVAITVTNAVNLTGTAGNDSLTGTAAVEELDGLAGNDRLEGAGGSDTIRSGDGRDTLVYAGNPFDGADVSAAGRQIIANEDFVSDFSFANDAFQFNSRDFNLTGPVNFVSLNAAATGAAIPAGTNVIVLRNADDDNNPATVFGAAAAATQVANLVTTDGAGFIVYANSALGVTRILYSTNLNDANADVKVVARLTDLTGQAAIDALASFTAANFAFDRPPVFTSAAAVSVIENRTIAFTAAAADGDGTALTYSLSGADAGFFNINAATGVVTFKTAPDFEAPTDAGGNNVYDVVVTATDGRNATMQDVAVTVANAVNVAGTPGNDNLVGTAAIEEFDALAGNDRITGAGGSDTFRTGIGSDTLVYVGDRFDGVDVSAAGRQIVGNEDFVTDFDTSTPLTSIQVNPTASRATVLSAALAGNIYFNVHSITFPGGEVRGQLTLVSDNRAANGTGSVTFNSTLSGANEVPPVTTPAQGVGMITFTVAADGSVTYTTRIDLRDFDVSQLRVGHLHEGAVGQNGPVVQDIVANARANGSITGSTEADIFEFDAQDFGIAGAVSFVSLDANAPGAAIPANANVIVLRNADNDGNPATAFNAPAALAQVAALVTTDGAGFIVYFNSVLGQNRILYSANLNDAAADARIIARLTDVSGQAAIDALAGFTQANFRFGGEVVTGTAAAETLTGTNGNDFISGLGGADTIVTNAGNDGVFFDRTSVGSGPDQLSDFAIASDRFVLDTANFGVAGPLKFQSTTAANLVNDGSNVIVLRDTDNDANAATAFNARAAAQVIGGAVTVDGAGFFVYFNSVLGVNRLVFSENLSDGNAAITVLGAVTTVSGQAAIDQLAQYQASNFQFTGSGQAQQMASAQRLTDPDFVDLNMASGSEKSFAAVDMEMIAINPADTASGGSAFSTFEIASIDDAQFDVPVSTTIEGF